MNHFYHLSGGVPIICRTVKRLLSILCNAVTASISQEYHFYQCLTKGGKFLPKWKWDFQNDKTGVGQLDDCLLKIIYMKPFQFGKYPFKMI
jgi:hypothetical protein